MKIIKFILALVLSTTLYSYELPSVNVDIGNKAEIILFSAQSVLVEKKLSYIISWKTINATKVKITYLGEISLSGNMTITEDEYKMGPITLEAINTKNNSSDKQIINQYIEADRVAPVMKVKVSDVDYYEGGIPRTYHRRWNPRNIH